MIECHFAKALIIYLRYQPSIHQYIVCTNEDEFKPVFRK